MEDSAVVTVEDENTRLKVEEENTRLKVALENLHKIFREKFQVVTLNDKALEALSEKKERDAKVSSLQKQLDDTSDKLQNASETIGELHHDMKELAVELDTMRERLAETLSELDEARGVLGDSKEQIKELRSTSTLQKISMKFQQAGFSLRKSVLLHAGQAKQSLLEDAMGREANLQEELDQERKMVAEQRTHAQSAERRIAEAEAKMSMHAAEAEEAFAAHAAMYREQALQAAKAEKSAPREEEMEDVNRPELGEEQAPWEKETLLQDGQGFARLRDLLLEQPHKMPARAHPAGLERDEVWGAVELTRRICDDRAVDDSISSTLEPVALAEYVYAWFGRQASHRAAGNPKP